MIMIKTEIIDDDNDDETIVEILSGKLRGTITKISPTTTDDNDNDNESIMIASYVGIPFADPPVGDLRWRPPNYPLSKDNIDKAWVTSSSSSNGNSNNNNKRNDEDNRNKMSMVRDCSTNQYRKLNIAHQSKQPDKYIFIEGLRNGMGFSFLKRILLYIILYFLLPYFLTPPESEDCLYLNVHVPKKNKNEKNKKKKNDNDDDDTLLPVMVWFHGGAHHDGQGTTDPLNKSHQLCTVGNVILVIVNYRLGLFGFFCHPELTKESSVLDSNTTTATSNMNSPSTCGNYGLLDQIASLKWVRDNIQAFGGNPNNITIFGESAGGEAVMYLLTSPFSKGLFHRAIAQSPSNLCQLLHRTQQTFCYSKSMQDCGIDFANYVLETEKKMGRNKTATTATTTTTTTTTIELLRKVPATKLMNLFRTDVKNFSFYPVIDGVVLPYSPFECFRQGKEHKNIPLMIGSNTDEGSLIWPLIKTPVRRRRVSDYNNNKNNNNSQNSSITERLIQEEFCNGNDAERLFKLYPGLRDGDSSAQSDCLGDSMFGSKAYYYAIHHANTNTMNNDTIFAAAAAAAAINDTTTTTIGTHTTANATAACYLYQFGQHPPSPAQTAGAYHLAELPYVFGGVGFNSLILPVDTSTNLSEVMSKYWTNFATTGSPNNTNNNQDDDDDSPTTHTTSTTTTSNDQLPDWRACKPIVTSTANGHKDENNNNNNKKNNDNDNKNEWMYFGDGIAKMATLNDAKKEKYDIMNRKLDRQLDRLSSSKKDK